MDALKLIDTWAVPHVGALVVHDGQMVASRGERSHRFPLASVTKPLLAYGVLVAVEEGTVDLDDPAGPPGSTVRHLLAHASGLAPDEPVVLAPPATKRIYSNAGFEVLGRHLEVGSSMTTEQYVTDAVLRPLAMAATSVTGSPAHGATATLDDLGSFAAELLRPRLVDPATMAMATTTAFAGLNGVLPGFGAQAPNDWGLGFELRDGKQPHWTGARNSPATFGHFGRSGTFMWVDPVADVALVVLTDRGFGPWAASAWPALSDAVLAEVRS